MVKLEQRLKHLGRPGGKGDFDKYHLKRRGFKNCYNCEYGEFLTIHHKHCQRTEYKRQTLLKT